MCIFTVKFLENSDSHKTEKKKKITQSYYPELVIKILSFQHFQDHRSDGICYFVTFFFCPKQNIKNNFSCHQKIFCQHSLVAQRVVSLPWNRLLLWRKFNSWPANLEYHRCGQKEIFFTYGIYGSL